MDILRALIVVCGTGITLTLVRFLLGDLTRLLNARDEADESKKKEIRQPVTYLIIGLFMWVVSLAGTLWFLWLPDKTFASDPRESRIMLVALCGFFTLCGALIAFYQLNWQVLVQEDGFVFRNFFRVSKRYSFAEIYEQNTADTGGSVLRYYRGRKRILTVSLIMQANALSLTNALTEWYLQESKRREANAKAEAEKIEGADEKRKKLLKTLFEAGWDALDEPLKSKLLAYAQAKDGELLSDYFSFDECVAVVSRTSWHFQCTYHSRAYSFGSGDPPYRSFFIISNIEEEPWKSCLCNYLSVDKLFKKGRMDGKPLSAVWNEIRIETDAKRYYNRNRKRKDFTPPSLREKTDRAQSGKKIDVLPPYLSEIAGKCTRKPHQVLFRLHCPCGNDTFEAKKAKSNFGADEEERWKKYWKRFLFLPIFEIIGETEKRTGRNYWRGVTWFGIRVGKYYSNGKADKNYVVVRVKCPDCGRETVLFDSRRNGYNAVSECFDAKERGETVEIDDAPTKGERTLVYRKLCQGVDRCALKVKIVNDLTPDEFYETFGDDATDEDYANAFTRIVIQSEIDGRTKTRVDEETA